VFVFVGKGSEEPWRFSDFSFFLFFFFLFVCVFKGWGTHVTGNQTYAADNHIVGNRLISVMSNLNDGGCTCK
jgi:hypothetical protein